MFFAGGQDEFQVRLGRQIVRKDLRSWVRTPPAKVGRGIFADICIENGSISRRHCEFLLNSSGALIVRDLGSKNGVVIDDRRVEEALVLPGTEVRIGLVTLRVEETDEPIDRFGNEQQQHPTHGDETHARQSAAN